MKSTLGKILGAAMMAGLCIAPTLSPAVPPLVASVKDAQRRDAQPLPANAANVSAMTLESLLGSSDFGVHLAPRWPHNRPQPGWRAVQSRHRHKQHMKRRRHNS